MYYHPNYPHDSTTYSPINCYRHRQTEREDILRNPVQIPLAVQVLKAFTIWKIWPSVTFFTGFATVIIVIHRRVVSVELSSLMLDVLGIVIGFVVSYRTSSAHERYNEGRKQWSQVILASRTLGRLIWNHTSDSTKRFNVENPPTEEEKIQVILEKKTMMNLIEAFSVSLKHHLRGEYGIYYEDLYHLACFLPTYSIPTARASRQGYRRPHTDQSSTPSNHDPHSLNGQATEDPRPSNESEIPHPTNIPQSPNRDNPGDPTSDQTPVPIQTNPWETPIRLTMLDPLKPDREILPAYNPPKESLKDMSLFVSLLCCVRKGARSKAADRYQTSRYGRVIPDDNIPQEIIEFLSTYIALLQIRQSADGNTIGALLSGINSLSDALTTLERIITTPVPVGYIVHLKLVIWAYLFFVPFQMVTSFGYLTIPAVALLSTAFLGFVRVGEEIENPFGYDLNDLDMDYFCDQIIAPELARITSWRPTDPTHFIFSSSNLPLAGQGDLQTADQILKSGTSLSELESMLRHRNPPGGLLSTISSRSSTSESNLWQAAREES